MIHISSLFIGLFILVAPVEAIEPLSIRLQQPKSPTNTKELVLDFVSLDIYNRPIIAKCFKKGPRDTTFIQFGSDISLKTGGNSGQCQLNQAITDTGSYQFMVTATADSDNTSSLVVGLDYITSTPGTPQDYRKEELNDCDYKIHFKTADDNGNTTKVEVYRSDLTSFVADSGSRVASINIGSNQEHNITNSVPDCSKTYYYALRAFNSAGNGSGLAGDSIDKVVYRLEDGTIVESLPQEMGTDTQGAIAVTGADLAIPGSTDTGEPPPEGDQDNLNEDQQGQVLGTKVLDYVKNNKLRTTIIAIFLLVIGLYVIKKATRKI